MMRDQKRLVQADSTAMLTEIITIYHHGKQKTSLKNNTPNFKGGAQQQKSMSDSTPVS